MRRNRSKLRAKFEEQFYGLYCIRFWNQATNKQIVIKKLRLLLSFNDSDVGVYFIIFFCNFIRNSICILFEWNNDEAKKSISKMKERERNKNAKQSQQILMKIKKRKKKLLRQWKFYNVLILQQQTAAFYLCDGICILRHCVDNKMWTESVKRTKKWRRKQKSEYVQCNG